MILFENVTKTYPRTTRPALDDVNLEIPRGEFVFVVGTSGSGKSTMMQLVMKEQDATRGRILVAGRDLDRLPERKVPALRREIGCVFQDFRLLPNKTVFQNVAYALQVLGSSRARIRQTVPETLELVGLAGKEKRLPHQLSGGEQQRVAIARAFVNRPPILLADEPTGNLDPDTSLGSSSCSTGSTAPARPSSWPPTTPSPSTPCASASSELDRGRARQRHGGRRLHDRLHPARPARRGDGGAATRRPARGVRRPRRRGPAAYARRATMPTTRRAAGPCRPSGGTRTHHAPRAGSSAGQGRPDERPLSARRSETRHAIPVPPRRDRQRPPAQPLDGRLGRHRHDDLDVPPRPRPHGPAAGRHHEGLLVRPRPGHGPALCREDPLTPTAPVSRRPTPSARRIKAELEALKPTVKEVFYESRDEAFDRFKDRPTRTRRSPGRGSPTSPTRTGSTSTTPSKFDVVASSIKGMPGRRRRPGPEEAPREVLHLHEHRVVGGHRAVVAHGAVRPSC